MANGYGTPENPAQAPAVKGGWGGILAAGATALAGVAMDNEYLVAGGGAAGKSFGESYDNLNDSLVDEQRANRLADAAMARQKHLATFERDLTQPDRDRDFALREKTFGLAEAQEKRIAESSKITNAANQLKLDEAKKMSTPEGRKAAAMEAYELQKGIENLAKADQIKAIENSGLTDPVKKLMILEVETGKDFLKDLGKGKSKLNEAARATLTQTFLEQIENDETYEDMTAAEKVQEAGKLVNAFERQLGGTDGGALGGIIEPPPTPAPTAETIATDVQAQIDAGNMTIDEAEASAETAEEKAAIKILKAQGVGAVTPKDDAETLQAEADAAVRAEKAQALQGQYNDPDNPLAAIDAKRQAGKAGIKLDTGAAEGLSPQQKATAARYIERYKNANATQRAALLKRLRENAPQELVDAVVKGVK